MKQQEPAPWPPKMPQGQFEADESNGCTYVNGRKIVSSWHPASNAGLRKGEVPSR